METSRSLRGIDAEAAKSIYSNRVGWYVSGRPTYPRQVLTVLADSAGLSRGSKVADIGSGTGIFSALLLSHGCEVFGVEPNAAMRSEAERRLADDAHFHSVDGSAEATTLPDASVDLVTAAQSLHWFDRQGAGQEFKRVLRREGRLAFVWNERRREGDSFLQEFDALLLRLLPGYAEALRLGGDAVVFAREFLGNEDLAVSRIKHEQQLDETALLGRVFSTSYAPAASSPAFAETEAGLRELYRRHQSGGLVRIEYETIVIVGRF